MPVSSQLPNERKLDAFLVGPKRSLAFSPAFLLVSSDHQKILAPMRYLEEGAVIRNTYEVERFLGEGAFAEVYRVKHRFLGRQAIKIFKSPGMAREAADRLFAEAILLSQMGHPNIIRVFDAGLVDTAHGECAYMTMEYVAGGTLEDYWKSFGSAFVSIGSAVELLRQVCRGLSVAHGSQPPIVHRDLKPQNILVGYDGTGLRARISDFGLAKGANPMTLLVSAQGTTRFKAPEVFRDPMGDSVLAISGLSDACFTCF